MGSYEGAFSAESAAGRSLGTTHGGAGEARGAGGWVSGPSGHAKPGCALENESPAGRGAGGYQVVGAGPRPPELGRTWAQTPGPLRGGGGGAAATPVTFLSSKN
jgi:hypothetical protein